MSLQTLTSAVCLACLLVFAFGEQASAQSFGRTITTGSIGSSGFGSSGSGSSKFGSIGFGNMSGIGGTSGFANTNRFQVDSSAGTAFIGRDSQDIQTFFSADESGKQSFMHGIDPQPRNKSSATGHRRPSPPVKITLRIAFNRPILDTNVVGANIESQLAKSLQGRLISPRVTVSGRTAVLVGQVSTAHERLLAEKLALLEPGVYRVENRIIVTEATLN